MRLNAWSAQVHTIEQMLKDRGCTNIQAVLVGTDPLHLCSCRDDRSELWNVYLSEEQKTGVKTLRKLRNDCTKQGARRAILVGLDGLTPFAQKELKATDEEKEVAIEIFKKSDLAFNVCRHHLVPKHEALSPAEKKDLLSMLKCKGSTLPKIKGADPVVRYLGCPAGTVLRIYRNIGHLEREVYYRIVVA